jgi:hypothetical protein
LLGAVGKLVEEPAFFNDSFVNALGDFIYVAVDAVLEIDAEGYCADVKMMVQCHPYGFEYFFD